MDSILGIQHTCGECSIVHNLECTSAKVRKYSPRNYPAKEKREFQFELMIRRFGCSLLKKEYQNIQPGKPTDEFFFVRYGTSSAYTDRLTGKWTKWKCIHFIPELEVNEDQLKQKLIELCKEEKPKVTDIAWAIKTDSKDSEKAKGTRTDKIPQEDRESRSRSSSRSSSPTPPFEVDTDDEEYEIATDDPIKNKDEDMKVIELKDEDIMKETIANYEEEDNKEEKVEDEEEEEEIEEEDEDDDVDVDEVETEGSSNPIAEWPNPFKSKVVKDDSGNSFLFELKFPTSFLFREDREEHQNPYPETIEFFGPNRLTPFFGKVTGINPVKENGGNAGKEEGKKGFNFQFVVSYKKEVLQGWVFGNREYVREMNEKLETDEYFIIQHYKVADKAGSKPFYPTMANAFHITKRVDCIIKLESSIKVMKGMKPKRQNEELELFSSKFKQIKTNELLKTKQHKRQKDIKAKQKKLKLSKIVDPTQGKISKYLEQPVQSTSQNNGNSQKSDEVSTPSQLSPTAPRYPTSSPSANSTSVTTEAINTNVEEDIVVECENKEFFSDN